MADATPVDTEQDKRRSNFFVGLAVGVVGAGILAPLLMLSFGTFDKEPVAEEPEGGLGLACQTFYGSGGAAAETMAKQVDQANKNSEWDPKTLTKVFVTVKTGLAAASSIPGLSAEEFKSFKDLAQVTEEADYAFNSSDSFSYPTNNLVEKLQAEVDAVEGLCDGKGT